MFIVGPSRRRSGLLPMNVTVVVELTSRIQDLPENESRELLAHGVNPIDIERGVVDLRHLLFWKRLIYEFMKLVKHSCELFVHTLRSSEVSFPH